MLEGVSMPASPPLPAPGSLRRPVTIAVASVLLVLGAAACANSRGAQSASTSDADVVGWRVDLERDNPRLLPSFETLARRHECSIVESSETLVGAHCTAGNIALLKDGLQVSVVCTEITVDQCHALFESIGTLKGE